MHYKFVGMEVLSADKTCRDMWKNPTGCNDSTCARKCRIKHGFNAVGHCFSFFICGCDYDCFAKKTESPQP